MMKKSISLFLIFFVITSLLFGAVALAAEKVTPDIKQDIKQDVKQEAKLDVKQDSKKGGIKVTPGDILMVSNETKQIKVKDLLTGEDVTAKATFSTDFPAVATVEKNGKIVSHANGKVIGTVKYNGFEQKFKVKVVNGGFAFFTTTREFPVRTWIRDNIEIYNYFDIKDDGSGKFSNKADVFNGVINPSGYTRIGNTIRIINHFNENSTGSNTINLAAAVNTPYFGADISENVKIYNFGNFDPSKIDNKVNYGYNVTTDKLNSYNYRTEIANYPTGTRSEYNVEQGSFKDIQDEFAIGYFWNHSNWVALNLSSTASLMLGTNIEKEIVPHLYIGADLWIKQSLSDAHGLEVFDVNYLKLKVIDSPVFDIGVKAPFLVKYWDNHSVDTLHGQIVPYIEATSGCLSLRGETTRLSGSNFGKMRMDKIFLVFVKEF